MMQGDKPEWRQVDFNSDAWPLSTTTGFAFNKVLKPEAIGWLRTGTFVLPEAFSQSPMALYIISGASYEVYWNGHRLGTNGRPANTRAGEIDGLTDARFYIPPKLFKTQGNVLAIRYSAHGYKRLHLPLAFGIDIGAYNNAKYARLKNYVPGFLLVGAVAAAAVFFGTLFYRRRKDRASLWLALMFVAVIVQSLSETSRALYSFSYLGEVLRILLTFLAAYGSGLFLSLFTLNYFRLETIRRPYLAVTHVGVLGALALFYSQFDLLSFASLIVFVGGALALSLYATYLKRRGSIALLVTLLLFCVSFFSGYTLFLDRYYFFAMALLAATLFVLQASAFREAQALVVDTQLKLNRLELDLLKRQIQPHFIMNTLSALSEWILTSPQSSVDMIDTLAEEFRILNDFVGEKLVPLERELTLCRAHLKLMSYRRDQDLTLEVELDEESSMVPPAVFHTLIENALSHSRFSRENTLFQLRQKVQGERVEYILLTPPNQKKTSTARAPEGGGMGLSYVKARLEESWGEGFSLDDGEDDAGRWRTRIELRGGVLNS